MKIPTPIAAVGSGLGTTAVGMPWPIVVLCVCANMVPSVLDYLAHRYRTRRQFDFADKLLETTSSLPVRNRAELTRDLTQVVAQNSCTTSPAGPDGPAPTPLTVLDNPP
ncbi:hypothetical protein [Streptomyces sp. NBC_01451]|uniref:hypothetical protein n=1 Tax=Streptomyces sp. NBC_01451 TaxID=2903872 RepID=UPI002E3130D5|nr:hypothetical protein [Streptomyces sp. NBC_01451]